jgi:glucose/arabinose dehydrogenase
MLCILKNSWLLFITTAYLISCKESPTKNETAVNSADSVSLNDLYKKYQLDKVQLPPGFSISVFASVPNARSMCWGSNGVLFIGNREGDNVYAVTDANKDGISDQVYTVAKNLNTPCGVAFRNGSLYVSEVNRILRYDDIESRLNNPPQPVIVFDKFPDETRHGWKFIAFGPDGKLYVPVGAPCNICEEEDSVFATITRINPDGTGFEIYSKGVRNSVGFAWHPDTKELWFTDNGRDEMGDEIPNCELNHAPRPGMHFGFPYCHQGNIPDPEFGKGKKCSDYTPPVQFLGPHVAPLGMRFYTGSMFPAEYKNKIFIAQHGSWNRSVPIGYRVMLATLEGNKVVKYEPFAIGWLQGSNVLGRPVDIEIAADGAVLVSDDKNGLIYRITYKK